MLKTVARNTGVYVFFSFFNQGITSLMWFLLAWWLDPGQVGLYFLAMFIVDFFTILCVLALDSAIGRFYYSKDTVPSVFTNAVFLFLISLVLFLVLFFASSNFLPYFIPGLASILKSNLLLFAGLIFVNSLVTLFFAHYVTLKKASVYGKLQTVKTVLFFLLGLLFVKAGLGAIGIFYSLFISSLFVIFYFILKERKIVESKFLSPRIMKGLLSFGLPLLLYNILGVASAYVSRLLLDRYTDLATLGIYSFFLALILQVNGLWSTFNRAWTPETFSNLSGQKENRAATLESINFMVFALPFLYLLGFFFLVLFGKLFLFAIIFKGVYLSSINLFYILLLSPIFVGINTIASPLYYYPSKTKFVLFSSIVVTGINILLTVFLTRYFFDKGAAFSYFLSSVITCLLYLLIFKKISEISSKIIIWTLFLAVFLSLAGLAIFFNWYLLSSFAILVVMAVSFSLSGIYKKKDLIFSFFRK